MLFLLYDHRSQFGENTIKTWILNLQKAQRAKLNAKLDMLQRNGIALFPEVLTGTDTPGVLKLRVKGNVHLRPMLCKGPTNTEQEFTLLIGAVEIGGKLKPSGADAIAGELKKEILNNPETRRIIHERIS
jgi:hypothetical protein